MFEDLKLSHRVSKAQATAKRAGRKDLAKEIGRLHTAYLWADTRKGWSESAARQKRAEADRSPEYVAETHGAVGGALVGGALFGPVGALVGARSTSRTEIRTNPYRQHLEDRAAALEARVAQHEADKAAAKLDLLALIEFVETNL